MGQDFDALPCSMEFDTVDSRSRGAEEKQNNEKQQRRKRILKRREKDLAMDSDHSDVDLSEVDMPVAEGKKKKKALLESSSNSKGASSKKGWRMEDGAEGGSEGGRE